MSRDAVGFKGLGSRVHGVCAGVGGEGPKP